MRELDDVEQECIGLGHADGDRDEVLGPRTPDRSTRSTRTKTASSNASSVSLASIGADAPWTIVRCRRPSISSSALSLVLFRWATERASTRPRRVIRSGFESAGIVRTVS